MSGAIDHLHIILAGGKLIAIVICFFFFLMVSMEFHAYHYFCLFESWTIFCFFENDKWLDKMHRFIKHIVYMPSFWTNDRKLKAHMRYSRFSTSTRARLLVFFHHRNRSIPKYSCLSVLYSNIKYLSRFRLFGGKNSSSVKYNRPFNIHIIMNHYYINI